jgi:thiamine kinase-like enzyme
VHGDPNPTNVLQSAAAAPKFIDWEWSGRGLVHSDLACLTKSLNDRDEARALELFTGDFPQLSPGQHRQLYNQAKLARALLDASFLSAQQGNERAGVGFDIEGPLQRALHASRDLSSVRRM